MHVREGGGEVMGGRGGRRVSRREGWETDGELSPTSEEMALQVPRSKSGVALTIDFIPGVVPPMLSRLNETAQKPSNQSTTNADRLRTHSVIDDRKRLAGLGLAAEVDSLYTMHGIPKLRRVPQTKPAKKVSLFHAGKCHYLEVEPEDLQGEIIQTFGPEGLPQDEYFPIDAFDRERGIVASYLNMCPPELRRSLKLRSASICRRRTELRTVQNWVKEKKAELAILRQEYKDCVENAGAKSSELETLLKAMDDQPLERINTKQRLKKFMEKMNEVLKEMERKEEAISNTTKELMELKQLIVTTRYNITRVQEAHDRDCERMHKYVEHQLQP